MRRNRIGELRWLFDLIDGNQHFRRDFLVQLDVGFELRNDRPRERFKLWVRIIIAFGQHIGCGFEIVFTASESSDLRAITTLDQHFHRAVGQL